MKQYNAGGEYLPVSVLSALRPLRNWHARVRRHPYYVPGLRLMRARAANLFVDVTRTNAMDLVR